MLQDDDECTADQQAAFTRSVAYFCGQHADCLVPGSRWALQRAKRVVEMEYSVVGILERMNDTLAALEAYVPRFFAGAAHLYYGQGYSRRHENRYFKTASKGNQSLDESVVRKLKRLLQSEYELYDFCQQRLHLQMRRVANNQPTSN